MVVALPVFLITLYTSWKQQLKSWGNNFCFTMNTCCSKYFNALISSKCNRPCEPSNDLHKAFHPFIFNNCSLSSVNTRCDHTMASFYSGNWDADISRTSQPNIPILGKAESAQLRCKPCHLFLWTISKVPSLSPCFSPSLLLRFTYFTIFTYQHVEFATFILPPPFCRQPNELACVYLMERNREGSWN